jgi:hypothetical protein
MSEPEFRHELHDPPTDAATSVLVHYVYLTPEQRREVATAQHARGETHFHPEADDDGWWAVGNVLPNQKAAFDQLIRRYPSVPVVAAANERKPGEVFSTVRYWRIDARHAQRRVRTPLYRLRFAIWAVGQFLSIPWTGGRAERHPTPRPRRYR